MDQHRPSFNSVGLGPPFPLAKFGAVLPCDVVMPRISDLVSATDDTVPSSKPCRTSVSIPPRASLSRQDTLCDPSIKDMTMTKTEMAEAALGLSYLVFTLVLTVYYLRLLSPVMSNDLWWAGFNSSGAQSYIIDVFNNHLNLAGTGSIDFTSKSYGLAKDYSTFYTPIEVATAYPLMALKGGTGDLAAVIAALRDTDGPIDLPTQYCWIDLNRTWEVAHTARRQKRCYDRYTANGGVYFEVPLRLVNWQSFMKSNEYNFNQTMGNALRKSAKGLEWIRQTTNNAFMDVATEVAYWNKMGITTFELEYNNLFAWGMDEKIFVQNAFGGNQAISIKNLVYGYRGSLWSTAIMCWGPWNDMNIWGDQGLSLVRNDPDNQRFTPPCSYADYTADPAGYACDPCKAPWNPEPGDCLYKDFESYFGFPPLPGVNMVSANIGPFGSVDLYLVALPPSLKTLVSTFQQLVTVLAQSNDEFNKAFMDIPGYNADPVPPSWTNIQYLYMGGDPSCPVRQGLPYVQSSFAFDASCSEQERHTILLNKFNMLFALVSSNLQSTVDAAAICSMCPLLAAVCSSVVTSAATALTILIKDYTAKEALQGQINAVRADIAALGVGTIQLAVDTTDGNDAFLSQTLLATAPAAWDVFGWVYLFEWAVGVREVVSFEGDSNTFPLVSNKYAPVINQAHALEVPKSACQYLWVVSVVVSAILVSVGAIFTGYTVLVRVRIVGRNLFRFNRIVGAVWLGRPLLLVRGMTAVVLLSTSPLTFGVHHGYTQFEFTPRTFIESMIVSGEAMWISYVINDILLLLSGNAPPYFAPISTGVGWIIYFVYDVASPYRIIASINRKCEADYRLMRLSCESGQIELGSSSRAITLVIIQLACIFGSFVGVKLWQCNRPSNSQGMNGHLLLSGTATAFLRKDTLPGGTWVVDRASCVMCGLLTFGSYFFDLKLWLLVQDPQARRIVKWGKKVFPPPQLNNAHRRESIQVKSAPTQSLSPLESSFIKSAPPNRIVAIAGLFYVFATIFGSVTYLKLTSTNMANDFWWANYNASREHAFVANLYNQQLVLRPKAGAVALDDSKFIGDADYNTSLPTAVAVLMTPLYVTSVKATDGSDVATVVRGLRNMDACLAPWISTQYCWLNFEKTWEMANSAKRQLRCNQNYTANGAVYLESMLRNVNWNRLASCWGTSLTTAFAAPLSQVDKGTQWWNTVKATRVSESDEVNYWTSFGVTAYKVDWQNYKSVGIIGTFNIHNAFGLSYPMTLKYTNGTFKLTSQTSMKMYWTFASDLWAVTSATSNMGGASLIRNTPNFAFATQSMETILVGNGTIQQPSALTGDTYGAFRNVIGPFGSVDVKHMPPPPSLTALVLQVQDEIAIMRTKSKALSVAFSLLSAKMEANYVPASWIDAGYVYTVGGNLLCSSVSASALDEGVYLYTGAESACGLGMGEFLTTPPTHARLIASVGANIVRPDVTTNESNAICSQIKSFSNMCLSDFIQVPTAFLLNTTLFPDPSVVAKWRAMAVHVQEEIRVMDVNIAQYVMKTPESNITLVRQNLFDPALPAFHYIGWLLAYDWAIAAREVMSFQGDVGSINVITTRIVDLGSLVNPLEIPVNVAYYIRYACVYVTCIMICVAALAMIYLLANRGYVEGLNLFELNRVAGIVWIGRIFVFIRSIAAINLLSTQVLQLEPLNLVYHFVSTNAVVGETATDQAIRHFKTFLAASEVSWLVFVLNDILMVLTQQYTTAYIVKCNFMVWGLSAILSFASPTTHTASLDRKCEFAQVDYQLVYYIDPASAVINGILSIRSKNTFYIFDLKIWRLFVIEEPVEKRQCLERDGELHLLSAIPLND
ncbi:hypothetical protein DYB30_006626 [Aphanomyces astaci]|uniref:Uncharacterized protein n=1 Tax=Aphanomyces astaci TaxID=112090 RepID=A0A397CCZ4_APHAT|nr:hypothetical protein DYB30_006626 [Aphanomyces astaci]